MSARRQRLVYYVRGLFRTLNVFNDKDDEEYPRYEAGPGGRDMREDAARVRRSLAQDGEGMTMEQELASFRDAATRVSNLIAAEEGRNTTVQQPMDMPHRMPQYHHEDGDSYFPGYMSDTASLPPYETEELDASMVADGMQYTPGQMQYTPESSPAASISGSDRLGYDNKD